ncbi:MAG: hypothetical protein IGS39_15230 [Calothrix sp. C42_A2020_038]|nr:hypothetical protein [Calothrix sp. C42_A2020_038]
MKIFKIFLIVAVTLFYPSSFTLTSAQTSTQRNANFNLVRDKSGNLVAINNLTIGNQRYNARFIYGSFNELFYRNNPIFWQNQQAAQQALSSINTVLNARKSMITQIGFIPTKYQSSKFAGSGNSFIIPVSGERIIREYGKKRTENLYINGVLGAVEPKQKIWTNYSFDAFSLTPDTPFMYVKLETVKR